MPSCTADAYGEAMISAAADPGVVERIESTSSRGAMIVALRLDRPAECHPDELATSVPSLEFTGLLLKPGGSEVEVKLSGKVCCLAHPQSDVLRWWTK